MDSEIVNITKIKDGFFLGDEATAANLDLIFQFKITHMINSAGPQILNAWENIGTKYLTLNWYESSSQNLFDPKDEIANRIVSFIDDSFKNGEGFLVHSVRSKNRACLVVLIYFIRKFRWSLKKALDFLRSKKPDIDIPSYFINQLSNYEIRLTKIGEGPKSTSWNDLGTGLVTDLDNEELLIRNTFLNGNISSSIDDILLYKNFQIKKYTGRRIKWDDKNRLISNMNNKKDLLLQNVKDIKQVTNHLTMKPSKSMLKSMTFQKEDKKEEQVFSNNYLNKQVSNDKTVNIGNSSTSVNRSVMSNVNINSQVSQSQDKIKYTYETNDYKNIYSNSSNVNDNINNDSSSNESKKQYLNNHGYLRESSIKKKDTNNINPNTNMGNNKNLNSYSSYNSYISSNNPYSSSTSNSTATIQNQSATNFNQYYSNVNNKNDNKNDNDKDKESMINKYKYNYDYDNKPDSSNSNSRIINSKYDIYNKEDKTQLTNIKPINSKIENKNNNTYNNIINENIIPIQRGHTPTKQIQQVESNQKDNKRPSTADQKDKTVNVKQKDDPKTYIIIAPTIQNVYNNVNQYIMDNKKNQKELIGSKDGKDSKTLLEKSSENQRIINNTYFNNPINSNHIGNDSYFNLQNKKVSGVGKSNKNGFLNTSTTNSNPTQQYQYQYQGVNSNSNNTGISSGSISINNSNPNSSFKRNSIPQRQGISSQNGPVRIQSSYGNSKPLTPDVSVNKR